MPICPVLLEQGFCLNSPCQNIHNISNFCSFCRIALTSAAGYTGHVQSARHRRLEALRWLRCIPCNRYYRHGSPEQTSHETSARHITRTTQPANAGAAIVEEQTPPNRTRCGACNVVVFTSALNQHLGTPRHAACLLVSNYLNAVALTQQNRNGVEVSGEAAGLDMGVLAPGVQPADEPETVWISNTHPTNPISLIAVRTTASLDAHPGVQLW